MINQRTKVIGGLALLVVLWAAAAVPAVGDAFRVISARITANTVGGPAGELMLALEAERRASAAGSSSDQRSRTDAAVTRLREARDGWTRWLSDTDATRQAGALLDRAGGLAAARTARSPDAYTAIIDPAGTGEPTVYPDRQQGSAAGLLALARAREFLAREDALLAATSAQPKLSGADRARLATLAGTRRSQFEAAGADLPPDALAAYRRLAADPRFTKLRGMEDDLVLGTTGVPRVWSATFNQVNTALWEVQTSAAREATGAATPYAIVAIVRAGLVGGVGLVGVIAVLIVARRRGRQPGFSRPAAVPAPRDDRRRLDPLLRDLDRRNQSLLHRQLRLLDALARRESDDETLGDLFRADHLANRMRRNLEKAITLTGGSPGRQWREPVPMGEIIRGAASEISEYGRVSTSQIEPARLAGGATTDLMHLLAELIENAATFGPAESRVRVTGSFRDDAYVVTVTDVGPGMSDDDLATATQIMADPVPPASGTWWGLWAAGRLAARQNVTVRLANEPGGGLAAVVTVPPALVFAADPEGADPRAANPQAANPQAADPQPGDLEAVS